MSKSLPIVLTVLLGFAAVGLPTLSADENGDDSKPAEASKPKKSKFDRLTEGKTKVEGLLTLYHDEQKLYAHLKGSDLGKEYIVLTSIARGISRGMVLGGMTWDMGDEHLWTFKKVGEKMHVIRRNVRFKAKPGTPTAEAVKLAYSDSVLYALPILAEKGGGYLVDMTRIFMSDDQQIGRAIGPGFRFASDRSTWNKVKAFPKNVELEVAAVYAGRGDLETVSDSRGVQVYVHYSISELPENDYKPRLADDRVGYFLTVLKNFSKNDNEEHFVRYINRWNLQKADPSADLSPPTDDTQIVFYIEKTVPIELRPIVEEAILEWNKAFEKLGFYKAIKVIQQKKDDTWDPEDIRYNTFRWITAEAGFAMGPSRVNPKTGEILDADIIFDASFLRYWDTRYETFTPEEAKSIILGTPTAQESALFDLSEKQGSPHHCFYGHGMQQQMGFAASVFAARGQIGKKGELPEEFIRQGLKEVVMHEVGHTLGLRHNFKASAWKDLEKLTRSDSEEKATVASVMDYSPANIAADEKKQGLYYTQTIGPYDHWAIKYGYKPISGNETEELEKIASRGTEPGHDYATDEDTQSFDSDPLANRYDLGADPVKFARRQMKLSRELLPKVVKRTVDEGENYHRARQAFGLLLSEYWRSAYFAARYPGGLYVHRDHKGDPNARPPFDVVDPEKQRAAMKALAESAFGTPEFEPDVLNHLGATRWRHWGIREPMRIDYPIHETVAMMQRVILNQLTRSLTLTRLHDNELKVPADVKAYTLAEHLRTLVESIFTEWREPKKGEYTADDPYISSFRRNLQRLMLKELASLVTSDSQAPEDARTLARMHLSELNRQITELRNNDEVKLDDYSRAHLLDSQKRIKQVLNAELQLRSIN